MIATIILSLAIVLNGLAALFALRLVRTTGKTLPWVLIGGALCLLVAQGTMQLFDQSPGREGQVLTLVHALVSFSISALLVAGVALVAPLLQAYKRNEQFREILKDRTMVVTQHHEDQLRSLKQMHVALEVGKPVNMIIEQVNTLTHLVQEFLESMKSGLVVGDNFGVALQALIEEMCQGYGLPIQVKIDSKVAEHLTKDQSLQLMHITREAVRNSQRHSQAKKVSVTLKGNDKVVALEIVDNGRGFEVDLVQAQGNGLGNMVARARKIGARLKINSKAKQGTHVHVEIPIAQSQISIDR